MLWGGGAATLGDTPKYPRAEGRTRPTRAHPGAPAHGAVTAALSLYAPPPRWSRQPHDRDTSGLLPPHPVPPHAPRPLHSQSPPDPTPPNPGPLPIPPPALTARPRTAAEPPAPRAAPLPFVLQDAAPPLLLLPLLPPPSPSRLPPSPNAPPRQLRGRAGGSREARRSAALGASPCAARKARLCLLFLFSPPLSPFFFFSKFLGFFVPCFFVVPPPPPFSFQPINSSPDLPLPFPGPISRCLPPPSP